MESCKNGLSTPPHSVMIYYCSFQGDTSVVVPIVLCFGVDFVLFARFYILVKFN